MFLFSRQDQKPPARAKDETAFLPRDFRIVELDGLDTLLLTSPETTGQVLDLQLVSELEKWRGFQTISSRAEQAAADNPGSCEAFREALEKLAATGLLQGEAEILALWQNLAPANPALPAQFHSHAPPPVCGHIQHDALHAGWMAQHGDSTRLEIPQPPLDSCSFPKSITVSRLEARNGTSLPPPAPPSGNPPLSWDSGSWVGRHPASLLLQHREAKLLATELLTPSVVSGCSHPHAIVAAEIWSDLLPPGTVLLTRTPHAARRAVLKSGIPAPPLPPWEDPELLLWQQSLLSCWSDAWLLVVPSHQTPGPARPPGLSALLTQMLAYQVPSEWRQQCIPPHSLRLLAGFVRGLTAPGIWEQARLHASIFFRSYHLPAWNVSPTQISPGPETETQHRLEAWASLLENWPLASKEDAA